MHSKSSLLTHSRTLRFSFLFFVPHTYSTKKIVDRHKYTYIHIHIYIHTDLYTHVYTYTSISSASAEAAISARFLVRAPVCATCILYYTHTSIHICIPVPYLPPQKLQFQPAFSCVLRSVPHAFYAATRPTGTASAAQKFSKVSSPLDGLYKTTTLLTLEEFYLNLDGRTHFTDFCIHHFVACNK